MDGLSIVKDMVAVLQVLLSIALIFIVMAQTTKSEGLSGTIGGQVTSSFKGKPGMDEQIRKYTIYVSFTWFLVTVLTAWLFNR